MNEDKDKWLREHVKAQVNHESDRDYFNIWTRAAHRELGETIKLKDFSFARGKPTSTGGAVQRVNSASDTNECLSENFFINSRNKFIQHFVTSPSKVAQMLSNIDETKALKNKNILHDKLRMMHLSTMDISEELRDKLLSMPESGSFFNTSRTQKETTMNIQTEAQYEINNYMRDQAELFADFIGIGNDFISSEFESEFNEKLELFVNTTQTQLPQKDKEAFKKLLVNWLRVIKRMPNLKIDDPSKLPLTESDSEQLRAALLTFLNEQDSEELFSAKAVLNRLSLRGIKVKTVVEPGIKVLSDDDQYETYIATDTPLAQVSKEDANHRLDLNKHQFNHYVYTSTVAVIRYERHLERNDSNELGLLIIERVTPVQSQGDEKYGYRTTWIGSHIPELIDQDASHYGLISQ